MRRRSRLHQRRGKPVHDALAPSRLTEVGAVYLTNAPGEGLVFHDVGLIRFAPGSDFEGIDVMHGPHDIYSDFASVEQAVCDALT